MKVSAPLYSLRRVALINVTAAMLVSAVNVPGAFAEPGEISAPVQGSQPVGARPSGQETWTIVNTPAQATGVTPSGVTMTVRKKLAPGARVGKADALPADHAAPADEYLVPVNAKAVAGIGDLYEGFRVRPNRWNDVATLTFSFSRPVRNPRLHIAGTGGATVDDKGNREDYWSGVRLTSASPAKPVFTKAAGFPGFQVRKRAIVPTSVGGRRETTCGVVYMCGSARIDGLVSSFTVDVRARNVRHGKSAGDPFLWGVFRVTFDEDDSDAPASYGAASHSLSDQVIGKRVTADNPTTVSPTARALTRADADDSARAVGRAVEVNPGRPVQVTVPVRTASPAVLAGWLDLNRDGRFQPEERAAVQLAKGAKRARLTWTAPATATPGATWLRLRLAADAADVAEPTGWAATGEVEDHPLTLRAPALRLAHSAVPRKARQGRVVTLTTKVTNLDRTVRPYLLTMDAADLLDDARFRGLSPRPATRAAAKLTWQGALKPGQTREIQVRALVRRGASGNGRLVTSWLGEGIRSCVSTALACGVDVEVRPSR